VETSLTLARQFRLVCLLYGALLATVSADEKHKQMPFSVELGEPFTFDGVPPLQAFAHAHADVDGTKWLFVTGRHNGLHGFSEPTPEDPENDLAVKQANQHFWVIDIENRKVWKSPLAAVKHLMTDPLRGSNCLHCQVGDKLYVVGGYGASAASRTTGNMTTFNSLTRIDVSQVVSAVINKSSWGQHVLQTYDDALRVTGGGMLPLDGDLIIVFGQVFDGLYSPAVGQSSGVFFQQYTRQIRRVKVSDHVRLDASVQNYPDYTLGQPQPNDPSDPYRRRPVPGTCKPASQ
jgi:hypothetical protein